MDNTVLMRVAVIENKEPGVKLIMNRGLDVNSVLSKTGPTSGYTALHWACAKNHVNLVKLLINDYNPDVNVLADDGIQPIMLAAFLGHLDVIDILLDSGADANARFKSIILKKYLKDANLSDDFDEMTLIIFAALNNKAYLASALMDHKADVGFVSACNKTLLMYAIERDNYEVAVEIALKGKELVNVRDHDGRHVFHYLFDGKYGEFRYDQKQFHLNGKKAGIARILIDAGADILATVDGDQDTLLVNMAAYRACYEIVKIVVNLENPLSGRPLYYATLPVGDKYCRTDDAARLNSPIVERISNEKENCVKWILKDLVLRSGLGLWVNKEEKELMDNLISKDTNLRNFVESYEEKFIGFFKSKFVNGECSWEVLKKIMSNKVTKKDIIGIKDFIYQLLDEMIENDGHLDGDYEHDDDGMDFVRVLEKKIMRAEERIELLEKVTKISDLRKAIPLPFEIVLLIIEYIDNQSLNMFVNAFYI